MSVDVDELGIEHGIPQPRCGRRRLPQWLRRGRAIFVGLSGRTFRTRCSMENWIALGFCGGPSCFFFFLMLVLDAEQVVY